MFMHTFYLYMGGMERVKYTGFTTNIKIPQLCCWYVVKGKGNV